MDFERLELDLIFKIPFEMNFFVFVKISMLNGYIIEIFKWGFILMDFMGFFLDFQNGFTILVNNNIFQ